MGPNNGSNALGSLSVSMDLLGLYGSFSGFSLGPYALESLWVSMAPALESLWVSMSLLGLYGSCSWVSLGLYALASLWISMAPALGSL